MSVGPDRVCVIVARTRHKMMQVELQEAANRGAKFIEVRLDFLSKAVDFKRLLPAKTTTWMATLRRPADGGRWPGTEQDRQVILRQAIVSKAFEWIDLETDIASGIPRFGTVKRVISYHNLEETPSDLDAIYDEMLKQDGDVYKLAVMAQTPQDCQRIIALQKRAPKPTVAFCMGDLGFPTRFIALKYWAPWIYASFNQERALAPGLPTFNDFRTTYPVRAIGPDTRIFGLLGDPVNQSFSPLLHNHMFRRMKVDALYLPFRVPASQFAAAIDAFQTASVAGYSVTIPHKEAAAKYAADREPSVDAAGAANTLLARADGKFLATNTDTASALGSLNDHLDEIAKKTGTPVPQANQLFVLILGAGGVARAIAQALHDKGTHVTIASRTHERAAKLAEEIGCKVCDWQARHNVTPCEIVINCTPVGMHPNVNETPLHASFLKPGLIVFDTIYNPEHTQLISDAKQRGCTIITGVDMFVRQAAAQFERFTGLVPPQDQMRELMRKALLPLTKALDDEIAKSEGKQPEQEADAEVDD